MQDYLYLSCQPDCPVLNHREVNHCSGSVAFFGDFKTSLTFPIGSAIPANLTGINHYHVIAYPTDIPRYFSIESLSSMADNTAF